MTPQQADELYYKAYGEARIKATLVDSPLVTAELRYAACKAIIDAVANEIHTDYAKKYLEIGHGTEYDFTGERGL